MLLLREVSVKSREGQCIEDRCRAIGRFLLCTMQCVLILCILVVLKIDFNRLGLEERMHVIRDHLRLNS